MNMLRQERWRIIVWYCKIAAEIINNVLIISAAILQYHTIMGKNVSLIHKPTSH